MRYAREANEDDGVGWERQSNASAICISALRGAP